VTDETQTATETAPPSEAPAAQAPVPATPAVVDYKFTLPEGATFDDAQLKAVTEYAHKAGLNQEHAQELVNLGVGFAQTLQQQLEAQIAGEIAKQQAQWREAVKADPEIGGVKFERATKDAATALSFARPGFKALLDSLGIGDHPDVIHALALFGSRISPDSLRTVTTPAATTPAPDPLAKIFTHPTSQGKAA
jgi:hypothetical protein